MWCGVRAKNICDVGRGVGSLSLNPLRMFMLNERNFLDLQHYFPMNLVAFVFT